MCNNAPNSSDRYGASWSWVDKQRGYDYSWSLSYLDNFSSNSGDFRCGGTTSRASLADIAMGLIPKEAFSDVPDMVAAPIKKKLTEKATEMLAMGWPTPPTKFPIVSLKVYGSDENKPRQVMSDNRLLQVDELPDGPLLRYYRDIMVRSYVVNKKGEIPPARELTAEERMQQLWSGFHMGNMRRSPHYLSLVSASGFEILEKAIGEPFTKGMRTVKVVDYGRWKPYLDRLAKMGGTV